MSEVVPLVRAAAAGSSAGRDRHPGAVGRTRGLEPGVADRVRVGTLA